MNAAKHRPIPTVGYRLPTDMERIQPTTILVLVGVLIGLSLTSSADNEGLYKRNAINRFSRFYELVA